MMIKFDALEPDPLAAVRALLPQLEMVAACLWSGTDEVAISDGALEGAAMTLDAITQYLKELARREPKLRAV